jgi:nuclear receptor interaction protein
VGGYANVADGRLCIWTPDPSPPSTETSPHPLKLADTILTGHHANIFSAHFLPEMNTPTAISCAGDDVIGVYEVERLRRVEGGRFDGELDGRSGDGWVGYCEAL